MAYNTKPIIKDVDGNPISQYYNPLTDKYEEVEGTQGGNKVVLYNSDGTPAKEVSLLPVLEKLNQLTGSVVDESSRKSNEVIRKSNEEIRKTNETSRVNSYNIKMARIDKIEKQVPEAVATKVDNLESSIVDYKNQTGVQVGQINTRVDNIITTPTTGISNQEIIDARDGKASLGANVQGIKEDLTSHKEDITKLQNEKANKKQEEWITPTLLNGATSDEQDPFAIMIDSSGFVHMKGMVQIQVAGYEFVNIPNKYIFNRSQGVSKSFSCVEYISPEDYTSPISSVIRLNYVGNFYSPFPMTVGGKISLDGVTYKAGD